MTVYTIYRRTSQRRPLRPTSVCLELQTAAEYFIAIGLNDLGPKLYIAMATADDNTGTTKAHLDVTDAINILAWSRGDGPAALWHIFPAAHTATVRHFLRQEYALPGEIDPVHSQKYYLSDAKLARLKDMHGISPWTLHQRVGDAILIPAGCIHQVSLNMLRCGRRLMPLVVGPKHFQRDKGGVRLRLSSKYSTDLEARTRATPSSYLVSVR